MPTSSIALRRAQRDPEAFAEFYDQHARSLLASLTRRVCDPDVALDLVAESFAQAYRSRARFRGTTEPEATAWLYRIASRQLARYWRKQQVERRAMRRLGIERPELSADDRAQIKELAGLDNVREELRVELARLSAAQRDALQLRIVEELPYSEVAQRLQISEQAARARVARGLKGLAGALEFQPPKESTR